MTEIIENQQEKPVASACVLLETYDYSHIPNDLRTDQMSFILPFEILATLSARSLFRPALTDQWWLVNKDPVESLITG